jgi:hypothetical protein
MRHRRLTFFIAATAVTVSCTSNDAGTARSRSSGAPTDSTRPTASSSWFDGALPLILAPAHSNDRALVVLADSAAPDLEDGAVQDPGTLIQLNGSVVSVRVSLSSGSEGCVDAALEPAPSDPWGVGFVGRAPAGLPVDSIRSISRHDSTLLTAAIFRLASGVPNAPGGRFAGLPFSLVDLWRVKTSDGRTIVVATTRRQINQEDSPLEERTLLVAEADASGALSRTYSSRSSGPEETVEGSELLAAVSFGGATQLVFSHDYGEETSYSIVERSISGSWRLRWVSRRFSC